jgi:hypothetical protein
MHYWNLASASQRTGHDTDFFKMGAYFFLFLNAKNQPDDDGVAHRPVTLMLAQSKYASEPRDKIYAVMPLMPEMFKDVFVDYGKSVQEVFAD